MIVTQDTYGKGSSTYRLTNPMRESSAPHSGRMTKVLTFQMIMILKHLTQSQLSLLVMSPRVQIPHGLIRDGAVVLISRCDRHDSVIHHAVLTQKRLSGIVMRSTEPCGELIY